jgi:hypothetical protein
MIEHLKSTIVVSKVERHDILKPLILSSIEEMGRYGIINSANNIYNTDWHLNSSTLRKYYQYVQLSLETHNQKVKEYFGYTSVQTTNYWMQQYATGGFHKWHTHENCTFSNVYYVDLDGCASKTTFLYRNQEFEVDVQEGCILSFPSFFIHCSKPNITEKIKTVIAYNSNALYETLLD